MLEAITNNTVMRFSNNGGSGTVYIEKIDKGSLIKDLFKIIEEANK